MAHRHLGWKRQPHDHRDWHYVAPKHVLATLPASADCFADQQKTPPLLDQQDIGSCGPNTADEAIMYDQATENIAVAPASRLFIYYVTRLLMGTVNQDSGVDNRTLLKALNQYGFCPEEMWPYDTSKFTLNPPGPCFQAALQNRISNYAAVQKNVSQMKGSISSGHPIIFGFDVFQSLMSEETAKTGVVSNPTPSDSPIGGHDILLFAYDDGGFGKGVGPCFKFRNHWKNEDGTPWGDNGCGYISYGYATGPHADDFWVINAVPSTPPGPIPIPTPTPTPQPVPPGHSWEEIQQAVMGSFSNMILMVRQHGGPLAGLEIPVLTSAERQLLHDLQQQLSRNMWEMTVGHEPKER